jgi:hypothetical protein
MEKKYLDENVLPALQAPLKTATREGRKGQIYEYIPTKYVSDRLNEVWGLDWSFEIVEKIIDKGHVAVHARIHHPTEDGMKFKDAFGGAKYEDAIGLGDCLKKATSLALKKAASLVCIDLQDPEDAVPATDEQKKLIIAALKHLGKPIDEEQLKMINEMNTIDAETTINALKSQISK